MKTSTILRTTAIALFIAISVTSCNKKAPVHVVSIVHLDSVARSASAQASALTADTLTADSTAAPAVGFLEIPSIFKSRTQEILKSRGYEMMSCCSCPDGGVRCCPCHETDDGGNHQYRFASPKEFKKAYLLPANSSSANAITLEAEELNDVTLFLLNTKLQDGPYRLVVEGAGQRSINVQVSNGVLMVP